MNKTINNIYLTDEEWVIIKMLLKKEYNDYLGTDAVLWRKIIGEINVKMGNIEDLIIQKDAIREGLSDKI